MSKIAVPASLPHVFVGLFMGLYYSFAVLVVAEMLGAKFGLGWYIQFQTAYSGYANVYATLRDHGADLRRHRQASVRRLATVCSTGRRGSSDGGVRNGAARCAAAARNVAIDIRGVSHAFDLDGSRLPVLEFDRPLRRRRRVRRAAGAVGMRQVDACCGWSPVSSSRPRGSISAEGSPIDRPDPSRILVFQDPTLFPWATVWNNVATGLDARGVLKQQRARVDSALDLVGLRAFGNAYPHQLSGGMAQRAALARALVNDPALLLLDEPLGKLDSLTRLTLQEELVALWRRGGFTAILVTHDVEEAVLLASRVIVLSGAAGTHQGRIQGRQALSAPSRRSGARGAAAANSRDAGARHMRSRWARYACAARSGGATVARRGRLVVDHLRRGDPLRLSCRGGRPAAASCRTPTSARSPRRFASARIHACLVAYWASVFWLGVIVLSASLLASERARVAQ